MTQIGRKIYYDKSTGNVLVNTGEREGSVVSTTLEQDLETYKTLKERNQSTFDVLELEYGDYAQDFAESSGFRVNLTTKTLEFSYPDPNEPELEQPYRPSLSVEVKAIKEELIATQEAIDFLLMGGM